MHLEIVSPTRESLIRSIVDCADAAERHQAIVEIFQQLRSLTKKNPLSGQIEVCEWSKQFRPGITQAEFKSLYRDWCEEQERVECEARRRAADQQWDESLAIYESMGYRWDEDVCAMIYVGRVTDMDDYRRVGGAK